MTANENNEKYVAEAWINDGKDQEFKESFLQNLIQQLQGHKDDSTGFDADKLDGKHYYDIHKEIVNSTINLLSEIKIGNVYFNKENYDSLLPFDVIHLNTVGHDYYHSDDSNNEELKLKWAIKDNETDTSVNLNMVFARLYSMLQEEIENSYKTADFERDWKNTLESLSGFQETLAQSGSINNEGKINAASVNGISFYVKTLEEYNSLKEGTAEQQAMINNPRNVFIIREPYAPGETVDDFLLAKQPDTAIISKYYEFAVHDKQVEGEDGITIEKWLVYKHIDGTIWNDMVNTKDLLDDNTVLQILLSVLENNETLKINENILSNSFGEYPVNDDSNYPLANYIRSSGIRGLTSKYEGVNLTPTNTVDSNGKVQPKYINLDSLTDKIEDIIDNKIAENFDKIYPIGSIYISAKGGPENNPAILFGVGEWDLIEDRFLLGGGSSFTVTYDNNGFADNMGGEINHNLNIDEMPQHNHTQAAHSHSLPSNYHFLGVRDSGGSANPPNWYESSKKYAVDKITKGNYRFMITPDNSAVIEYRNTEDRAPAINDKGGSTPHNNMPPYLVVNIWRRVR